MTEKNKKIKLILDEIYKSVIALKEQPHPSVPDKEALRARKLWTDNLYLNMTRMQEYNPVAVIKMFED